MLEFTLGAALCALDVDDAVPRPGHLNPKPYNPTTLQPYNPATLQPYSPTTLQP